jgi:hypothetical protein
MTGFDVVGRLDRWAVAVADAGTGTSRGYSRSVWSGVVGDGVPGSVDLWTAEAMDTDLAVRELPPGPCVAVVEFWLHPDASVEQKCLAARMTRRTLYRNRERALALLAVRLGCKAA